MKMERHDFCSITPHPLHSHPPSPLTSSVTEFDNFIVNSDPYPHPLLPLPCEPDPGFSPLPLHHYHLPDLDFSLYDTTTTLPASTHLLHDLRRIPPLPASPKPKRSRLDLTLSHSENNPQTLDSIVKSFNAPAPIIPYSELARNRRQKLGEKTRCLQKLMPWDKKMDTGTMLQEAYKYIRFLQAQVSILQSMPITSSFSSTQHVDAGFAGLGKLNRQQLLQVLINSPVAQTMLCSQGLCVFASEQLVSLHQAKERKTVLQQFLCDSGNIN
ncbi:hypothetical protein HRI_004971200 [Hibiscus trionum]|uniref:BHLH domain-containing protein n=1 Tax=Hibiscus trionum TaxID=183268 RepID=A0A9W7JFW5_HIBTR|nr:hypothetical protein HRI_004971200 [Hibiscus trionum]